ncbi:proteoglycan Cow [Aricia agestis]|uniref:proteoglycan Cow n=1 Tax=Aricia agestis TaxID=91739 RepID=UPI001C206960|nr:proteoglycan Cow [Aricia agestis]XP_041970255.1 proteoglycan Cow [Aricia agestis]
MRTGPLLLLSAALLALAAADRRLDQDFEFDDAPDVLPSGNVGGAGSAGAARRPRRYTYDPHNPLCRTLVCKKREVCLLRDSYTALCDNKKAVLRRGDVIVAERAGGGGGGGGSAGDDDDVFYETAARGRARGEGRGGARCAGCGGAARAAFLCGSDNRTYSSLCRLDLHNCVRRARPPVQLACRGFCPCAAPVRPACALDEMADRLLDWFSVLLEEAGGAAPAAAGWPRGCRPEVRWMFAHLDAGGDGELSAADLWALRHDERERCLRPFLASCGGAGAPLSRAAWCGCLRRALRPCAALARAHPAPQPGAYVPSCDARGFYRPRQCHSALGVCWCVDAHGVELAGSRTKGAPRCPGEGAHSPNSVDEDEPGEGGTGGGGLDDEDAGGSGDAELRF